MSRYFDKSIEPSALFWGHQALDGLVKDSVRNQLLRDEFEDWLSSLYWLENIVGQYALRMCQLSPERKQVWKRVFEDEFNHQYLITTLLKHHNLTPKAPNPLVANAIRKVTDLKYQPENLALIVEVQSAQVFFEQYLDRIIESRTPYLRDVKFKNAFEIILADEQYHIAAGVHELKQRGADEIDPLKMLSDNAHKLFPFHLAKKHLSRDEVRELRKRLPRVIETLIIPGA